MPAFLKQDTERDVLTVSLGGLKGPEFGDALQRIKSVPGRRFNPDAKVWELPRTPEIALRVMTSLQPHADAAVQAFVQQAHEAISTQLLTRLPDDADLRLPWAERLFPYQRSGVLALAKRERMLLADEMGLGKTVQSIAAIEEWHLLQGGDVPENPTLVIAPKVVRGTWAAEFERWADISTQIIDGRTPKKRLAQLAEPSEAYVINWESFWRPPVHEALVARDWTAIIADEAHRAKNRKSHQSKGLRKLHAPVQFALTGTPVMNSPDELWALLAWLYPDEYTSFWKFHNNYVDEYTAGGSNARVFVGVKNPDALRFELADKMVRRRKKDKLPDLPDKMPTQVIEVELTASQRKLYEEAETALFLDMGSWVTAEATRRFNEGIAATVEDEAQTLVDELADMPFERLLGLVPNAAARIAKLRQITAAAKVAVADELIREEPETPVVAFTWHVAAARQLADALANGRPRLRVDTIAGDDDGNAVKDAFQAGELDHVVCTIAKGGTGLTLTRSADPLFVEEDWVPAINDQAIDRTHRIGQDRPVTPRVLRCRGTVDDGKVASKLKFKQGIVDQLGLGT